MVMQIIYSSVKSVCFPVAVFQVTSTIVNIFHVRDGVLGRWWLPCAFRIIDSIVILSWRILSAACGWFPHLCCSEFILLLTRSSI